jgi:hypothetical protein
LEYVAANERRRDKIGALLGHPNRTPTYLCVAQRNNRNGDRPYAAVTLHSTLGRVGKHLNLNDSQEKSVSISLAER